MTDFIFTRYLLYRVLPKNIYVKTVDGYAFYQSCGPMNDKYNNKMRKDCTYEIDTVDAKEDLFLEIRKIEKYKDGRWVSNIFFNARYFSSIKN